MNPTADPTAPPPAPPKPSRSSFSCDRHPAEQFTGFCPTCLCERLTTLENSSNANTPSSSRRPSSVTAAVKSIFSGGAGATKPPKPFKQPTSFSPQLRRIKSFSDSKNEALGVSFEPQRKSCDVRARSTLWSLFTLEKEDNDCAGSSKVDDLACDNGIKVESCAADESVFEEIEDDEKFKDAEGVDNTNMDDNDDHDDQIRPFPDNHIEALRNNVKCDEIVEDIVLNVTDLKPIKDHIDFDASVKKGSAGGFWAAASVFSKKWQKWRQKQKMKKQNHGVKLTKLPMQKTVISRHRRETQSEVADYGFARRSCDTDPRFSLDTGRISFDDPRYSFDKPRASWDGHSVAAKSFPRMAPMVSLAENKPIVHVPSSDTQIPVEEPMIECLKEDDFVPGGSVQTRDYYLDSSSSRRRKSLDKSSSIRKIAAELDELKTTSNYTGISPNKFDSLRDDCSEAFELSNGFKNIGNGEKKEQSKKAKSWSLRIWGFIYKRNNGINKEIEDGDEDERYNEANRVQRSLSESWPDVSINMFDTRNSFRSNSSVSWRRNNGPSGINTQSSLVLEPNGSKRDEFVLEKNRSIRYSSPNGMDHNGLFGLYLTPMRSGRRGGRGGGLGKIGPNNSHSIARNVLRLY